MLLFNGIDANYAPLMMGLGFSWRTERGEPIGDLYRYLAEKGINCARVRLWVGEEGPSRFHYATSVMEMAREANMDVYLVIFLSEGWADLYKQPAPKAWETLSIERKTEVVKVYTADVIKRIVHMGFRPVLYQVGNEIDYGICGIFASDKKRRKNVNWLKRRIWRYEAEVLRSAFESIKSVVPDASLAVHLGKWWDHTLFTSFLSAMEEFNVDYDVLCISFYPTGLGVGFEVLDKVKEAADSLGKALIIAEYAYPSGPMKGQFWFMNKQVPGYPMTLEGQAKWIRDFISYCRELGVRGIFYWSPELYLPRMRRKDDPGPLEMPLGFGWEPMALFDGSGKAKPAINSLNPQ